MILSGLLGKHELSIYTGGDMLMLMTHAHKTLARILQKFLHQVLMQVHVCSFCCKKLVHEKLV